jgi:cell shape-determining protein MreC
MSYHHDNHNRKKGAYDWWAFIVGIIMLALVVLFIASPSLSKGFGAIEHSVANAWENLGGIAATASVSKATLRDRIQVLEQAQKNISLNERYLGDLSTGTNRCSACVYGRITRFPSRSTSSYVISLGEKHGVKEGDLVLVDDLYVLGKVSSVGPDQAWVASTMRAEFTELAYHQETDTRYELFGRGNGVAEIHIPRDSAIGVGDWLYHPVYGDLVMGYIEHIIFDERDPFQTVMVRTPFRETNVRIIGVRK